MERFVGQAKGKPPRGERKAVLGIEYVMVMFKQ